MSGFNVPFIRPVFPSAEVLTSDIAEIVDSNWYTNFGPKERKFSASVARYVGEGYQAVTFANATIALIGALATILGRGDGSRYVIAPSFTFAAGPEAIEWCGYLPLFVDIELHSLQPSLEASRTALETYPGSIAAVLLCNTFGIGNTAIREWEELAHVFGIPLIIDSAAGFGSIYQDGSQVGSAGTCEIFSFHATKPFAIGEGGAVVTRDPDLATRMAEFTNFGFRAAQGAAALGLNGKLQEISAAIGLRQLEVFPETLKARRSVLEQYVTRLPLSIARFPEAIAESSVCFATLILPDRETRDRTRAALLSVDVEARAYYSPPVHLQPHFSMAHCFGPLDVTHHVVERALSVPVYQNMSEDELSMITGVIVANGPS